MNEQNTFGYSASNTLTDAITRNRVLRNTFALLALTMVPTILGAWVGVTTGFSFFRTSPFIGFIVFMAIAFGFFWAIEKNKNSGTGVILLLGFTGFMGLMLTGILTHTLQFKNGAQLIMMVFGGFLVGFGTRYAGGCTSGHAIMGLSNLQWPSLVATICFMAGGFFMANIILPWILSL